MRFVTEVTVLVLLVTGSVLRFSYRLRSQSNNINKNNLCIVFVVALMVQMSKRPRQVTITRVYNLVVLCTVFAI